MEMCLWCAMKIKLINILHIISLEKTNGKSKLNIISWSLAIFWRNVLPGSLDIEALLFLCSVHCICTLCSEYI